MADPQEPQDISWQLVDATPLHASVLAALHAKCFETAWAPPEFHELLALPNVFGAIAQLNNQDPPAVCGFFLCRVGGGEGEILTIGVTTEQRGQGVADLMLEHLFNQARRIAAHTIFLEVDENNFAAIKLYKRNGFEEVGRRPKYYVTAQGRSDALTLSKSI